MGRVGPPGRPGGRGSWTAAAEADLERGLERDRRRAQVAVERQLKVERLVRAARVVDVEEAVDLAGEAGAVGDLVPVQVLVLERLKPALDHAVGLGRAVAGAHVRELRAGGDVAREAGGAVAGAV